MKQTLSKSPINWKDMEVEAKWTASRHAYELIISEFQDQGSDFGYTFKVRWSGLPKKYVDRYFETKNNALSSGLHALRHRIRYTSKPRAQNSSLSCLINASWKKDWEKIQYKSTPTRIGAVWFRKEIGGCKIWDKRDNDLCPNLPTAEPINIITDSQFSHEALTFLLKDHPEINRQNLTPFMSVTDFRYRVILMDKDNKMFELSLDHLISENFRTGVINRAYEAELEIIRPKPSDENLTELFRISKLIQERYELTPSTTSKGGNKVPELEQKNDED